MRRLALATLAALLLALAAGCGEDDDSGDGESGSGRSERTPVPLGDGHADRGAPAGACEQVQPPDPKRDGGERPPRERLDANATYDVVLTTTCGEFTVRLDQRTSPKTAASFAALARDGFFDGTVFHRIVPEFVIQGGDPTGSGMGGPGYSTRDRPPADAAYTKGVVAMAKTEAEPPGTAGSQFYVVTGADAGLPPIYAVLGEVTEGIETVERIGELGDPSTEMPLQPVVIESATVREG